MARFVVTIPDDFLKEVDARAQAEHRSRSELVREALRGYLRSGGRKGDIGIGPKSEGLADTGGDSAHSGRVRIQRV